MSDSEELTIYHHNGICLVVEMKHVEILGRAVTLSETQFQIMHLLMRKPGRILSRSDILDWIELQRNCECDSLDRTIDVNIRRLRQRLFPGNHSLAKTVVQSTNRAGYRLADLRR